MRCKVKAATTGTHVAQGQVLLLDVLDAYTVAQQPSHGGVVAQMHRQRTLVTEAQAYEENTTSIRCVRYEVAGYEGNSWFRLASLGGQVDADWETTRRYYVRQLIGVYTCTYCKLYNMCSCSRIRTSYDTYEAIYHVS